MKVTIVEGTQEEIAKTFPHLGVDQAIGATPSPPVTTTHNIHAPAERLDSTVSVEIARKIMNRIPLSNEQRQVLVAVYEAYPNKISAAELSSLIGYTRAQFSGLMGAWGRRISNTPGYEGGDWFWEQEWDYENGMNLYSLAEPVREAIRQEKLV